MNAEKDIAAILRVEEMVMESTDPKGADAWDEAKKQLYLNRNSLRHNFCATQDNSQMFCKYCGEYLTHELHFRADE